VPVKPVVDVTGHADVVSRRRGFAAKDVDEAFADAAHGRQLTQEWRRDQILRIGQAIGDSTKRQAIAAIR
jgi:hypothetical protein